MAKKKQKHAAGWMAAQARKAGFRLETGKKPCIVWKRAVAVKGA